MLLITTADQRFWKTDEPVLFLGEWCKLFSQKAVWEKLDYEVLPYHWDDRGKLYNDYLYLDRAPGINDVNQELLFSPFQYLVTDSLELLQGRHFVNHLLDTALLRGVYGLDDTVKVITP